MIRELIRLVSILRPLVAVILQCLTFFTVTPPSIGNAG
jgi:hypothetical protein